MNYINICKITSTHGLKGELKLKSSFVYIDRVLKEKMPFYIDNKTVYLLKYRIHNDTYLVTFEGYEDINLVENFRNKDLYVSKEDIDLKDGEYLFEDYMGLEAYFNGKLLGTIDDILDCGNGNYVFDIIGNTEILIPVNNEFIEQIVREDKIVFKGVEGLIDAN